MVATLARGVDVSRYQKRIAWALIPDSVVFAQVGVTHWQTGELDWEAEANVGGALCRGLIPGGYQRINPIRNTPEREAALFLTRLRYLDLWGPGRLWPWWDIEPVETGVDPVTGKPINREADAGIDMRAWVRRLFVAWTDMAPDPRLIWYSSGSYFRDRYGGMAGIPTAARLCVAHWARDPNNPKPQSEDPAVIEAWAGKSPYTLPNSDRYAGDADHPVLIHQYSSRGRLPGIGPDPDTGKPINVDLNCLMPGVQLSDVMQ